MVRTTINGRFITMVMVTKRTVRPETASMQGGKALRAYMENGMG